MAANIDACANHILASQPDEILSTIRRAAKDLKCGFVELLEPLILRSTESQRAVTILIGADEFWQEGGTRAAWRLSSALRNSSPEVCKAILVGHDDPTRQTFIEDLIMRYEGIPRLNAVALLLEANGIDSEYPQHAFERHAKKIHDEESSSLDPSWFVDILIARAEMSLIAWFLQRLPYDPVEVYKIFIKNALSEHCMLLEDLTVGTKLHLRLRQLSFMIEPDPTAKITDVKRYAEWLIEIGRIHNASPKMGAYLIERLVEHASLIRQIIYCYRLADHRSFLRILMLHQSSPLMDIMCECGMFSSLEAKRELLRSQGGIIDARIWRESIYKIPTDTSVRTIIDLVLCLLSTDAPAGIIAAIRHLIDEDSFRPYVMVIINFLINKSQPYIIGFVCDLVGLCRLNVQVVRELTLLTLGVYDPTTVKTLMSRVSENPLHKQEFIRYANIALARIDDSGPVRLETLIPILGSLLDLSFVASLKVIRPALIRVILNEIQQRESSEKLAHLGDIVLAAVFLDLRISVSVLSQLVADYLRHAGPITCQKIFECPWDYMRAVPRDSRQWEILEELARNEQENYLRSIIKCWGRAAIPPALLELNRGISEEIKLFPETLILGRHKFLNVPRKQRKTPPFNEWTLIEEIKPVVEECGACKNPAIGDLFTDERNSFGVYYCRQCAAFLPTAHVSSVTCPVCLNDTDMHVLACKHAACGDCLARIENCPACRSKIVGIQTVQISLTDVIRRFFAERVPTSS